MVCLFMTFQRKSGKDLIRMNNAYIESSLDYLLVRPVGIGEEAVPTGQYYLQKSEKNKVHDDVVGGNMAKLDAARFMVDKAVYPTLHRTSQVVGSKPGTPMSG